MRPHRYPSDHCPQLADLVSRPAEARKRVEPFVDMSLYDFLDAEEPRRSLPGWKGDALVETRICRRLIVPPQAGLTVGYGLDANALGDRPFSARFAVEIRDTESGETTRLLNDEVHSDQRPLARKLKVSLADRPFAAIDLCLDAQPLENPHRVAAEEAMVWMEPKIRSRTDADHGAEPHLSRAERELRERQLRTLGYVQ
jgi:hypothetical protein